MSDPSAFTTLAAQLDAAFTAAFAAAPLPPSAHEEGAGFDAESSAELVDRVELDTHAVPVLDARERAEGDACLRGDLRLRQAGGFAQLTNLQDHGRHVVEPITSEKATPPRRLFVGGRWNPAPSGVMPPKRPGSEAPIAQAERLARFARSILGADQREIARELRTWRDRESNGLTDALLEEIAAFVAGERRAA